MKFSKSIVLIILLACLSMFGVSCAKLGNEIAANGGIWGSYAGDYIVRNDSGGKIMDMWVLKDVMVQEVNSGSGWLFRDTNGNVIHLGGDVKVIRVNKGMNLSDYHEYHAELESKSYQELYCQPRR